MRSNLLFGPRPPSYFAIKPAQLIELACDRHVAALITDLVTDEAFLRLKRISFLGAITYGRKPSRSATAISSRYQHSLGVARLALEFARLAELSSSDTQLIVATALLHDIGHPPLSHSLEPAFQELLNINHHIATENILQGTAPIGKAIARTLRSKNIRTEQIIALLSNQCEKSFSVIFNSPINIDTIDGILRAIQITNHRPFIQPLAVIRSLVRKGKEDLDSLDTFWRAKDFAYHNIIHNPHIYLFDAISQEFLRRNHRSFSTEMFYSCDRALRNQFPQLFALLSEKSEDYMSHKPDLEITKRRFHINKEANLLHGSDLKDRYYELKDRTKLGFKIGNKASQTVFIFCDDKHDNDRKAQGIF